MKTKQRNKPRKSNKRAVAVTAKPANKKGGRVCAVCSHPDRVELDRGLSGGTIKPADVARKVGCSRVSVGRHINNHLIPGVKTALKADPINASGEDVDLGAEIRAMYAKVKGILDTVERERNWKAIKAFHGEVRGYLELLGKFLGKIDGGTTVNVILSPTWIHVRSIILHALEPFPEARIATAQALIECEKTAGERNADTP